MTGATRPLYRGNGATPDRLDGPTRIMIVLGLTVASWVPVLALVGWLVD